MPDPDFRAAALPAVFEEAPVAMVVVDREGLVRMWNRAAEALLGWSAAEVLGKLPPYVPPDFVEAYRARNSDAFDETALAPITVRRRHRDGRALDLVVVRSALRDGRGEKMAILGILTDVTKKRREEEEQRRSEANFRALIEQSPDAIFVHRLGQVIFVNPRAVEMLGYDQQDDLIGRPVMSLIHESDRAAVEQRIIGVDRGQPAPPRHERLIRRDGTLVDAEVAGIPIHFDGQPARLAHARDLTERLRLEAELRARDRLASVGRLAAAVGHEINNPLAYVLGNLDLLQRRLEREGAPPDVRALLLDAREGAERVRVIVRDLKTFSQREREEPGPVDVQRVIESCIGMAQHEIRHRARLTKRYDAVPRVLGNEARLGQVFLNLLVNAAQAIPEGHVVENEIAVEVRAAAGGVEIEVRDTGVGIPRDEIARVFEPFFTTKPPGAGTGLGLAICRSIVEALGGTVAIESEPGKGTRALVRLRRFEGGEDAQAAAPRSASKPDAPRRILVVDDEPRVAAALAALLEPDEAVVVSGGRDALARLAKGERFDVVLCDLMMPEMSGVELFERIRAEHPGLERRVVFMTGGAFTPRGASFLASVPNACLEKPFDAQQLADAIDRASRAH